MPMVDMPLDELKTYMGRNPRPDDFEQYWDAAIADMKSVDPRVKLIPCETRSQRVEYFHLNFTGIGGARVYAKYLRPKGVDSPHPAMVVFHGYTGNSGDWFNLLGWAGAGFSVAALDCRGQGGLSEDVGGTKGTTFHGNIVRGLDDAPEKLMYRSIYMDCAQLAGIVMGMPEVDERRVGATGISQGGGLTLACAALEPRICRAAPQIPFLCDYKRVWEMDLAVGAYGEIRDYLRNFDPLHERQTEIWTKLGYIDNVHLAPRIRAEVLMMSSLMDTTCPPSTQFAAYNQITSTKDMVIYPDFGHEGLPGASDKVLDFMCGM